MTGFLHRLPEFIGHHLLLVAAFAAVLVALGVLEAMRLTRGFAALTAAGVTRVVNRDNALLIDLSPNEDFEKGHIPGARHVAMSQFDPENKELAKARELPVVVYCRNGQVSAQAARRLVKAGFTRVYWLQDGLRGWADANLPLAKGRG